MADPLKQFEIKPLIPLEIAGYDVSFTNSAMWMAIAVVTSLVFFLIATRKPQMVPGRAQVFAESMYEFIAGMVRDNIGSKGREYFPLIFTIFVVVLMGNMLGMIPYSFTYTSHIAVTMGLALAIFIFVTILGFVKHGTHFFSLFCPEGVPRALKPLIIPIEVLSYLIRPVTLSVRLFANMMAGHLMLKVFAGFSVAMGVGLGIVPMFFNVALIGFEFLIAFLQAYVFTILSCIYLKDAIELH
jgi:F-type H+-transporting ATPase subunit a